MIEVKSNKRVQTNYGVNVIYFTNRCNLACTYCYEDLKNKKEQILTKEQIIKTVDSILERENTEEQTLFVLFGGEVTLEWDNAVFCMDYAYSKKQNVHFNISSNGIKFNDDEFILNYKKLKYYKLGLTSLDISFDGIGNKERIFHSGKETSSTLLNVFKKLKQYNVNFRLRYTIHNLNIDNCEQDILYIINKIKPSRVITSIAWSTLSDEQQNKIIPLKNNLLYYWTQNEITVPVCEFFCNFCNGCDVQKEVKQYYSTEGNINTIKYNENAKVFGDFIKKENK